MKPGKSLSAILPCSDPDCVKQFRKEHQLLHHLAVGTHVYDSQEGDSITDTAKRLWAETCTSLRVARPQMQPQTKESDDCVLEFECPGYALKHRKRPSRFSTAVKDYLFSIFCAGESTGKKMSPFTVAKLIRTETDENGNRMFKPSEWLTHQQIRGVFANFALKKQKEVNEHSSAKKIKVEESVQDEDCPDEDLANVIQALVAKEHMDVVMTLTEELSGGSVR